MTDPKSTAARVLAGLAKGRQRSAEIHQARAKRVAAVVIDFCTLDALAGRPARGRAERVALDLHGMKGASPKNIRRIIAAASLERRKP